MSKYKKLLDNSIIFAIGNFGTKFIGFFLLPIYTYSLSKSEYGNADLISSTLSLLLPIITLSIFDAILRFAMDKNYDKQAVLTNSIIVSMIGFLCTFIFFPIALNVLKTNNLTFYFYLLMLSQIFLIILTQYVRAVGLVKLFSLSGIVNALVLLICNLIFLMKFKLGLSGYFISLILANIISIFYIILYGKVLSDVKISKRNSSLTKEMLYYSIPLIPNSLMWWIIGLSDRYFISFYLGLAANGMYAVANKVPSIINIINSIFFQAWQMSAIEEADSKDKSIFFSDIFNLLSSIMLIATSVLLVFLKLIVSILVTHDYYLSWKFIPFLLVGVVFSSFSGFLGTNYIASKKTIGVFKTSLIGAIINLVANIFLIPVMGINGASISTMVSFAIIWILRIIDTRNFVKINYNFRKIIFSLLILSVQILIIYIEYKFEFLIEFLLLLIMLIINLKALRIGKIVEVIK